MNNLYVLLFVIFSLYETNLAFPDFHSDIPIEELTGDPGQPLFLTPLIQQNRIKQAKSAAEVCASGFLKQKSYAGYLTVDKTFNSNLFFWYFPAKTNSDSAPVVVWLQGGPGASSLMGLFGEHGPFTIKNHGDLKLRKYSWTENHNVIYVDNPVGTGYSFTDNGGYAQNETKIGENLYDALTQFFMLFPELQGNEFFITGESYAGKYVPALAFTIHQNNPYAKIKINLQGLAIGNGLSDPEHQLKYGEYLYQVGLIDANIKNIIQDYEQQAMQHIQNKEYSEAYVIFNNLFLRSNNSLYQNVTGFENFYNYRYPVDPMAIELEYIGKYIQRTDIRAAIHVGNMTFNDNKKVKEYLINDFMQSVAQWISLLLSHYRILIYNGQLDVIVAYPLTENYLQNLNFSAANEYKLAQRYKWYVGTDLAGYVKQAGNLTEVLVRDAGHMVPTDQPQWAYDLISRFTRNKPYHE